MPNLGARKEALCRRHKLRRTEQTPDQDATWAVDAMSFSTKDLDAYRRDERLGHKLLTPEERLRLIKVRARRVAMHPEQVLNLTGDKNSPTSHHHHLPSQNQGHEPGRARRKHETIK